LVISEAVAGKEGRFRSVAPLSNKVCVVSSEAMADPPIFLVLALFVFQLRTRPPRAKHRKRDCAPSAKALQKASSRRRGLKNEC
jgi:hypothetical protein